MGNEVKLSVAILLVICDILGILEEIIGNSN